MHLRPHLYVPFAIVVVSCRREARSKCSISFSDLFLSYSLDGLDPLLTGSLMSGDHGEGGVSTDGTKLSYQGHNPHSVPKHPRRRETKTDVKSLFLASLPITPIPERCPFSDNVLVSSLNACCRTMCSVSCPRYQSACVVSAHTNSTARAAVPCDQSYGLIYQGNCIISLLDLGFGAICIICIIGKSGTRFCRES